MRKVFLGFSILITVLFSACASQQTIAPGKIQYQKISDFPGMDKNTLYEAVLKNIAYAFVSSRNVIQYQNKDSGQIILKGIMNVNYTIKPVPTHFTLTIEIKDNKMRSTFTDIGFENGFPFNNQGQLDSFSLEAEAFITQTENRINEKSSDW